jgi:dTDP-L-rhamnose 4-epimerase
MGKRILITGGAGFIGSHLTDRLLKRGHDVRILDSLSPQVHGPDRRRPDYLSPEAELIVADVQDPQAVRRALKGVDAVYHLAARVGVGQSMYQIADYTENNVAGTAVLLEALAEQPVERLVVASSMSIYGEGLYRDGQGKRISGRRSEHQLRAGNWELHDEKGQALDPLPTPESKTPDLASVYALSKYDQERLCLMVGQAYDIPTVALRFFNVYGERQALSNPYTGVLAIFASRLLNGKPPLIFEDGRQRRDFINVQDVVQACELALSHPDAPGEVFNVGSGQDVSVRGIAERMASTLGLSIEPAIVGKYRTGDIRNCFADISLARERLGFEPQVRLDAGMEKLAGWLEGQTAVDRSAEATEELIVRGLTV